MRAVALSLLGLAACGPSLPPPPRAAPPRTAFSEVPSPPPPARVEFVPTAPRVRAVWVDGAWEWTGRRYRWKEGGWFAPPPAGVAYADWEVIRPGDERLFFANAAWRDRSGAVVTAPRELAPAAGPAGASR